MDRKTICLVGAIIVVGGLFAFAGDLDPPKGPIEPTMHTLDEIHAAVTQPQCCSPRPEDIRSYFFSCEGSCVHATVIPETEGDNGFIITDITFTQSAITLEIDSGGGPETFFYSNRTAHFTSGIHVSPGVTVLVLSMGNGHSITISGYVY